MQVIFASRSHLYAHAASPVVIRLLGCRPNCIRSWCDRRSIASESSSEVSLNEDCNPKNRCSRSGSRSTGSSELSIRLRVSTEHNRVFAIGCLYGPVVRSRGVMALSQRTLASARKRARNSLAVAKSPIALTTRRFEAILQSECPPTAEFRSAGRPGAAVPTRADMAHSYLLESTNWFPSASLKIDDVPHGSFFGSTANSTPLDFSVLAVANTSSVQNVTG